MNFRYATRKLEKSVDQRNIRKNFGDQCARKIVQRLSEIMSASNLAELGILPGPRCHELKGGRSGHFAVDIKHPMRLVFKPDHDAPPLKDDGGIDWSKIENIIITEIKDYHK